jgi:hypothetical protein
MQQDVRLVDAATGRERPVGTNPFGLHAFLGHDRGVAMATRGATSRHSQASAGGNTWNSPMIP